MVLTKCRNKSNFENDWTTHNGAVIMTKTKCFEYSVVKVYELYLVFKYLVNR